MPGNSRKRYRARRYFLFGQLPGNFIHFITLYICKTTVHIIPEQHKRHPKRFLFLKERSVLSFDVVRRLSFSKKFLSCKKIDMACCNTSKFGTNQLYDKFHKIFKSFEIDKNHNCMSATLALVAWPSKITNLFLHIRPLFHFVHYFTAAYVVVHVGTKRNFLILLFFLDKYAQLSLLLLFLLVSFIVFVYVRLSYQRTFPELRTTASLFRTARSVLLTEQNGSTITHSHA